MRMDIAFGEALMFVWKGDLIHYEFLNRKLKGKLYLDSRQRKPNLIF